MALGDFLGDGIFTFIVFLLVVFLLWILWKIFAKIFGFGKQPIGKLSKRAENKWGNLLTKEREIHEQREKETAEESHAESIAKRGTQVNQEIGRILTDVGNTQNFGVEKVERFKALLDEQYTLLNQEREIIRDLEGQYATEKKTIRTVLEDLKTAFLEQKAIHSRAIDASREIEKYGQKDPNYSHIAATIKHIMTFETQLQDIEARDIDLARQLEDLSGRRRKIIKAIIVILEDSLGRIRKEPILTELPHLSENQEKIEEGMQQLLALNGEAKSLLSDHTALMQPLERISAEITSLLEQQQNFIRASLAHLARLAAAGAIPKKLAG